MIDGQLSEVRRAPRADVVLAVLVVAVIGMMVVPLPTPLIDLLIAVNLTFGVLLLAAALYMRDALSFAAFPTLLLLSTLYRLALNVSSTRLILLQADAGRVIEAFGSFVVRGDYRVGALVFAMLTLIQFIVIARGAERVAEVSARFSLDALPGKQLAIDAELRSGSLRPEAARTLRRRLERESQLFGALDGALKFVKGDAIAGIVITLVNFLGGVALGVFARELPLATSLRTYGLLTIGDGLVTQIPALLGATAAGLVVTRVSPDVGGGSLAREIGEQLFAEPRALAVSALVLCGLALVPELPAWPFVLLAALCVFASITAHRRKAHSALAMTERSPLTLELAPALHAELATRRAHLLEGALERARLELLASLGVELPEARIVLARSLTGRSFRFLLRELPTETASAGVSARDDIAQRLVTLGRERAADWLDRETVQRMIEQVERDHPALVRAAIPRPLAPEVLTQVLRRLLDEGISIRWLDEIIEAVAAHAERERDVAKLTEHARQALARRISHALAPERKLYTLRLAPEVEEAVADALRSDGQEVVLALAPDLARDIESAIAAAHRRAPAPHALLTQPGLRRHVRELVRDVAPDLAVISPHELTAELELASGEPIGP